MVVLPAPEGPTMLVTVPGLSVRLMPLSPPNTQSALCIYRLGNREGRKPLFSNGGAGGGRGSWSLYTTITTRVYDGV